MRTLFVLATATAALTIASCATSSALSSGLRTSRADDARTEPDELQAPRACRETLPPLPTFEPSAAATKLSLKAPVLLSKQRSDWVVPFHGLLLSSELRAREVERREAQAARLQLSESLRAIACEQWADRFRVIVGHQDWLEDEIGRLRLERIWLLGGSGGIVLLVALVVAAAG